MSDVVFNGGPPMRRLGSLDNAGVERPVVETLIGEEWVESAFNSLDLDGLWDGHDRPEHRIRLTEELDDVEVADGGLPALCGFSSGRGRPPDKRPTPDHVRTGGKWVHRRQGRGRQLGQIVADGQGGSSPWNDDPWVPPSWRGRFTTGEWMDSSEREWSRADIAYMNASTKAEESAALGRLNWFDSWSHRVRHADFYDGMNPSVQRAFDDVVDVIGTVANNDLVLDGVNRTRTQAARALVHLGETGKLNDLVGLAFLNDLLGINLSQGPGHMLHMLTDWTRIHSLYENGLAAPRPFENIERDGELIRQIGAQIAPANRAIASLRQGTWTQLGIDLWEVTRRTPASLLALFGYESMSSAGIDAAVKNTYGVAPREANLTYRSRSLVGRVEQEGKLTADLASGNGVGNCGAQAMVNAEAAREMGYERVEVFAYGDADKKIMELVTDHGFVVINRPYGSDPQRPQTWGHKYAIIDSWSPIPGANETGIVRVGALVGIYNLASMGQLMIDNGRGDCYPFAIVRELPRKISNTKRTISSALDGSASPPINATYINGTMAQTALAIRNGAPVLPPPSPTGTRPVLLGDHYAFVPNWMPPLQVVPNGGPEIGCEQPPPISGSRQGQRAVSDSRVFVWDGDTWSPSGAAPPQILEGVPANGYRLRWGGRPWVVTNGQFVLDDVDIAIPEVELSDNTDLGIEWPADDELPSEDRGIRTLVTAGIGVLVIGGAAFGISKVGGDASEPDTEPPAVSVSVESPPVEVSSSVEVSAPQNAIDSVPVDPPLEPTEQAVTALSPADAAVPSVSSQQTFGLNMSNGRVFPIFDFVINGTTHRGIVMDALEVCWVIQYGVNDADADGDCPPSIGVPLGSTTHLLEGQQGRFVIELRVSDGLLAVTNFTDAQGLEEDLSAQFFVTVDANGPIEIDGEVFS